MAGEFIEIISPKALEDLKLLNTQLSETVTKVKEVNQNMINIKTPSGSNTAINNITTSYDNQVKAIAQTEKALERARVQEIKLQQTREKAVDSYNKGTAKQVQTILNQSKSYQSLEAQKTKAIAQADKEALEMAKLENAYEKVRAKINSMLPSYNNLKTKSELGIRLSAKEEAQLSLLEKRLIKYRETLNSVNKSYGNYSLEVGNYAKGTSNLSNAIGQISRELPNFGQSFQIGVLSLTNNIGALQDSIKQVKLQNVELKAQGLQTTSVMKQIGNSILSFNTALYIGIGLFSAYSKEIGDWISSLFEGNKELKELAENQKKFNEARFDGVKDAQSEIFELKKYLSVVKDRKISDEERNIALKKLRSEYPFYFKNLTDEQILLGQSTESVNNLMTALEKRKEIEKKSELSVTNKQKLLDLQSELDIQVKLQKQAQANLDRGVKNNISAQALATYSNDLNKATQKRIELSKSINLISNDQIKNDADIFQLKKDTIALEFQDEKLKKEKTKRDRIALNFSEVESEYALKIAILERQKAEINDRTTNEQSTLDDRLKAREEFSKKSIEILSLEIDKEKALLLEKYNDDLAKNNLALKNKDINHQQWTDNIADIQNRFNNEVAKVDVDYSIKWNNLMNGNATFYKALQDEKLKYSQDTEKKILEANIKSFESISKNEGLTLTLKQKAYEEYLSLSKKLLDIEEERELAQSTSTEQTENIIQKYKELNNVLDETAKKSSPLAVAQKQTDEFIKSIGSGQLEKSLNSIGLSGAKMFLDFDKNGQTTFDKLLEGADTLAEKFAVTFQGVSEIAQEALGFLTQSSNAYFENQQFQLAQQRDVSIAFAGESATAREEIEKQYTEKSRALKRQQAKEQQKLAIFNILVNTAQGIVSALASTPPNVPLSIAIGAIGALQAGMVASTPLPEFYKGTDNAPEGWAYTQERGAEIITDKNGNVKSTGSNKGSELTYLNKGDKVFTASETQSIFNNDLNNLLVGNGISMPKVEINMDTQILADKLDSLSRTIANKPSLVMSKDERGYKVYQRKQAETKQLLNNVLTYKGYEI
jgi:hypothetical protein